MRNAVTYVALLTATLAPCAAHGEGVDVGDNAPPLSVSGWVKGDKVNAFEPGKLYVVEFWATWCTPCRTSIPHLTELQKKYKDVTFIGVSILEDDFEGVAPFVKSMGDKMDYRVAIDEVPAGKSSNEGKMAQQWLEASGEQGIPTAFLVSKDGRIAWIGHPLAMEVPLERLVSGEWDIAKAAAERKQGKERDQKISQLVANLNRARSAADAAKFLPEIDQAIIEVPEAAQYFIRRKLGILLSTDEQQAVAFADEMGSRQFAKDPAMLNELAWTLIDPQERPKPDTKATTTALKLAKASCELSEYNDPMALDTLALAYFRMGNAAKALEIQEKAIGLAEDDLKEEFRSRLEEYRKAAGTEKK
jgi:thiol-disulfide isomerase/thioredoxin